MKEINLVPKEKAPKVSVVRLSKRLSGYIKAMLVIFVMTAMAIVGIRFVVSRQINSTKNEKQKLLGEISALEDTEQKLFLLRDRLGKIQDVKDRDNVVDEIEAFRKLSDLATNGIVYENAKITPEGIVVTYMVPGNSNNLEDFIKKVSKTADYERIVVPLLGKSEGDGFKVELSLKR